MLFWALLAAGQTTLRRVDGWRTLDQGPSQGTLVCHGRLIGSAYVGSRVTPIHQPSDTTEPPGS